MGLGFEWRHSLKKEVFFKRGWVQLFASSLECSYAFSMLRASLVHAGDTASICSPVIGMLSKPTRQVWAKGSHPQIPFFCRILASPFLVPTWLNGQRKVCGAGGGMHLLGQLLTEGRRQAFWRGGEYTYDSFIVSGLVWQGSVILPP